MKTKFKLLTCGIAAAILLTSAAVAAATIPEPIPSGFIFSDSSWSLTAEDKAHLEAVELRSTPEWRDAFQEALLEGKSPVDPVRAVYEDVTDSGEIMPVYLDPASPVSTEIKLELVHDKRSGYGYNLWSGRFIVTDVREFASVFYELKTYSCGFDNNKDGQAAAEMKGSDAYSGNYKSVYVKGIYDKDGEIYTQTAENNGNSQAVNAYIKDSGGKLVEAAYYFYMHDGSGCGANYMDVAVIHVVDKDYAASAEYAAKPYAGLIDHYTYVDTENMGAAAPINAE